MDDEVAVAELEVVGAPRLEEPSDVPVDALQPVGDELALKHQ